MRVIKALIFYLIAFYPSVMLAEEFIVTPPPRGEWLQVDGDPIEAYINSPVKFFEDNEDPLIMVIDVDLDDDGDRDLLISDQTRRNARAGYTWNYFLFNSESNQYWTWQELVEDNKYYFIRGIDLRPDALHVGYSDKLGGYGLVTIIPSGGMGTLVGYRVITDKQTGHPIMVSGTYGELDFNLDSSAASKSYEEAKNVFKQKGYAGITDFKVSEYQAGKYKLIPGGEVVSESSEVNQEEGSEKSTIDDNQKPTDIETVQAEVSPGETDAKQDKKKNLSSNDAQLDNYIWLVLAIIGVVFVLFILMRKK